MTSEQYFQHVRGFIARLEAVGHAAAAGEVRHGFESLNGLTDGWAAIMQSLQSVQATCGDHCDAELHSELEVLLERVRRMVYRR